MDPPGGDLARLYNAIAGQFRKKLGKPSYERKATPGERQSFWDFKREDLQFGVMEEVDPKRGPYVDVALFVPEGEAD